MSLEDDYRRLCSDNAEWSQKTFGNDLKRDPRGPLKHLSKEAIEASEAYGSDSFHEELADCALLLLDAMRRGCVSTEELLFACRRKLEINKQRQWGKASTSEPVHHVK